VDNCIFPTGKVKFPAEVVQNGGRRRAKRRNKYLNLSSFGQIRVGLEAEAEAFACLYLHIQAGFEDFAYTELTNGVEWRSKEVELEAVEHRCLYNGADGVLFEQVLGEVAVKEAELFLAFDEIMLFLVDEDTPDEVTHVVHPVVFEGIAQEVIHADLTAVRAELIFFHIRRFAYEVVAVELEYIRVHVKDEDITGYFQLYFKLTLIGIGHLQAFVGLADLFAYFGGELLDDLLKGLKRFQGAVVYVLLHRRLGLQQAQDGIFGRFFGHNCWVE
jgi:hypothetical protein